MTHFSEMVNISVHERNVLILEIGGHCIAG